MDIPINLLQWEVFLPEQYKVKDFSGDVMPADRVPQAFVESAGMDTYTVMQPGVVGGFISSTPAAAPTNYIVEPLLQGQLGGLVLDPSGAVIPNAHVSVTSAETGYRMDATTNNQGFWRVWNVPAGRVDIKVESQGFQVYQARGYYYDAQRPQAFNSRLQVGAATETVEVTAGPTSVDIGRMERENKKQQQAAQMAPSANVVNLQRRVAGVLPVSIDVPHTGTAFHFVRPLVVNEETKVAFTYKSK